MTARKIFLPSAIASWSKDDLQRLRTLAQSGASIDAIAATLKRSASAVRNKAGLHGISLASSKPEAPDFVREINCGDARSSSVL